MKILKNILAFIGVLVVLIIGFAAFTGYSAEEFKITSTPLVESFVRDFSRHWRLEDIQDRATNDFLSQISTPEGKKAISSFGTFGELETITDMEMLRYHSGTEGTTAVFQFRGAFANGSALVEVELLDKSEKTRVQRIRLTPIGNVPVKQSKYET